MFKFITKSLTKAFGNKYDRDVKEILPIVDEINEHYATLETLSDDELRNKTIEFRGYIKDYLAEVDEEIENIRTQAAETDNFVQKEELFGEIDKLGKDRDKLIEEALEELLPEAFAVVKETARRFTNNETITVTATEHDRELAVKPKKDYVTIDGENAIWNNHWKAAGGEVTWNMVHYDVQLIGGIVLHQGKIGEMKTGEGKTLVATLPAYLNAIAGEGVHVITVNDYLARRDCEWIGPVMEFLHLTIDCIDNYRPNTPERRAAYNCDITYGTNNEFGFDYLRDNMVRDLDDLVQRKHHFAMVDEIDSILIDDARTPLIISGPIPKGDEQDYQALKPLVESLFAGQKRMVQQYLREAKKLIAEGSTGPQEGEGGLALFRAFRGLPKTDALIKFIGQTGMKAILEKTENFYMQEQSKNMYLADAPLLFFIDEKNRSVELTDKGSEFLGKGNQDANFFIMPNIGEEILAIDNSDLSDEEKLATKDALIQDFAAKNKRIHSMKQLLKAYTLFELNTEYLISENNKIKIIDESTGRAMEGRRYSDGLHQAIEAKEGVKIEAATQTYATVTLQNYFRMYHKLCGMTGTAETEAGEFWEIYKLDVMVIPTNRPIARDDREDLVYKTEREKFNAVVEEIDRLTKQGRPVLVGTTTVDISEKLSNVLESRGIRHNVLNAKHHQRESEIVAEAGRPGQVTIATNMAGRGTDMKLSAEVKAAGGLAIVGTERHDSRRVDRQLRGRAGRQGDPGSSQFFVSLEDKLMRLFHSERITKVMDKMGHQEGDVIQHSMVTKSIEKAQKRVEENNFGIRKRLLEYDDVMNIQREAIYKRRYNALSGERLALDLNNMFTDLAEELVYQHKDGGDFETFKLDALIYFGVEPKFQAADFNEAEVEDLVEQFQAQVFESYRAKTGRIRAAVMPAIKNAFNDETKNYKYIAIPYSNGQRGINVSADLAKAVDTDGQTIITDIEKSITLALIDNAWKEHLRSLDELKTSVQAAGFEQKDPLVVYKVEAYGLFEAFISDINREVVSFLSKGDIPIRSEEDVRQARVPTRRQRRTEGETNRQEPQAAAAAAGRKKPQTVRRTEKKINRNAACPCGSGKKYKQCHGKR
jgi:preprotein translocase subunit SecA